MLVLFETLSRATIEALKPAHSDALGPCVKSCIELDTMKIKVDLFVRTSLHLPLEVRAPRSTSHLDGSNFSHRNIALIKLMVYATFYSCRYSVCRLGEDEISWLIRAWQKIRSP